MRAVSGARPVIALPQHVLLREARSVASLLRAHQYTFAGIPSLPTSAAILAAVKAVEAHPVQRTPPAARSTALVLREARAVTTELRRVLVFYAEMSGNEKLPVQMRRVAHSNKSMSIAAWALRVEMWGGLAEDYRKAITGLGGFDARTIARAKELGHELRANPNRDIRRTIQASNRERTAKLAEVAELLRRVRLAARFVFRDQPELARQFTSEYERKRRARSRRKKKSEPA